MSRTFVYLDGFNLYYRALKGRPGLRWLNVTALAEAVLPRSCNILRVNYYTADVSGRVDPTAPGRQGVYLRALETLPNISIHKGRFLVSAKWAGLVQPPEFRPCYTVAEGVTLDVAHVYKTEEKGSDVNMGVHLVRDAFQGKFDEAAILTNDTDLVEAIRIVTQDIGLPVTLLAPSAMPSTSLQNVATATRHITPYLAPCQFPDPVIKANGKRLAKPAAW